MKIDRRDFLKDSLKATAALSVLSASGAGLMQSPFRFSQNPLPYTFNALEPHIDAMTMEIHYTRHHAAYLKNANDAMDAEKIQVKDAAEFFSNVGSFSAKARNNGGGVWNHNFFWQVMRPGSAPAPSKVTESLTGAFGSVDQFRDLFTKAATGRFGSGWAWLVKDGSKLAIGSTPNQDNPLMPGAEIKGTPLLALDVWEHAYYLKYQNKRADYISAWWNLVNWDEVARQL